MGQAFLFGQSTGVDVANAIIEQYKISAGNVNAGDFVEFVQDLVSSQNCNDVTIDSSVSASSAINAVLWGEGKAIISYYSNTLNRVVLQVVTFDNEGNITLGVQSGAYSSCFAKLTDTTGIMIYLNANNRACYRVFTVDGSTITIDIVSADTYFRTQVKYIHGVQAVDSNRAIVYFTDDQDDTYYYGVGVILTINGTIATAGRFYTLSTIYMGVSTIARVENTTRFLITECNQSNTTGSASYAAVINVNGTAISIVRTWRIGGTYRVSYLKGTTLEDKAIVSYYYNDNDVRGSGVNITDLATGATSDIILTLDRVFYNHIKIDNSRVLLSSTDNKCIIIGLKDNSCFVSIAIVTIKNYTAGFAINNNNLLCFSTTGNVAVYRKFNVENNIITNILNTYETKVKEATDKTKLGGIAKDTGSEGNTIGIYTLNT